MEKNDIILNFKKISERLLYLTKKNHGILKIEHKSTISDISSFLLGYSNASDLNQHIDRQEHSIFHYFLNSTKGKPVDVIQPKDINIPLSEILNLTDPNKFFVFEIKELSKSIDNQPILPFKIGTSFNSIMKTPQDLFIQPEPLKIISTNTTKILNHLQKNIQSQSLTLSSNKQDSYKIDLLKEIYLQDLWNEIFYSEEDNYSHIFINIIEQFHTNNNYQVNSKNIYDLLKIEFILSLTLNSKTTPFLKKILKKYLQSIGFNESNISNQDVLITKENQTKHDNNIGNLSRFINFIFNEYSNGNFEHQDISLDDFIYKEKHPTIFIPQKNNEVLTLLLKSSLKQSISKYDNLIINSSKLKIINLISHKKYIDINNDLNDFENFSQILFTESNDFFAPSIFFQNYLCDTTNHSFESITLFSNNDKLSSLGDNALLWRQNKADGGFTWEIIEFSLTY